MVQASGHDDEKLRPAGTLESLYLAMHSRGMFYSVGITASYSISHRHSSRYGETSFQDLIYASCATVIAQDPILSATADDDRVLKPWFVRLPEVDLDKCIVIIPEDSIADEDAFLEKQHNTPFPASGPMWKLYVFNISREPFLTTFTASFVYQHALGDGLSWMAFHKKFAAAVGEEQGHDSLPGQSPSSNKRIVEPPHKPLLPPMEALHPFPVSIPYVLKTVYDHVWTQRRRDPTLWTGTVVTMPLVSRYKSIRISGPQTANITRACKARGASVTGLLQELVAGTLFQILPPEYTALNSAIAVSTRRWMQGGVANDQMGMFVTAVFKRHSRPPQLIRSFIWDQAVESTQNIREFLGTEGKNNYLGLLRRYVTNMHKLLTSRVGAPRTLSFEISNLGVLDPDQDHPGVNIGRMTFSQTISAIDSAIQVSVITGGDKRMVTGFSWQDGVVANEEIMSVIEKTKSFLEDIGEHS